MTGRIIFLDFDGCVNNYAETPGSYVTHLPAEYGPSPSNVQRLRSLAEDCNAKIILTTNWRKFSLTGPFSIWHQQKGDYANPLSQLHHLLGDLIYSTLPPCRHMLKSEALKLWLEESSFDGQYAIFDDDLRERFMQMHDYGISKHYVHVNPELGITDADCKTAWRLLMA